MRNQMEQLPYRELIVWQRARALAKLVLDLAEQQAAFRRCFYYRDQMCRAAMSVPANIAEGNGRSTPLDYAAFIDRARGSLYELDTWLLMAAEQDWIPAERRPRMESEIKAISAMLKALADSLRRKSTLESRTR